MSASRPHHGALASDLAGDLGRLLAETVLLQSLGRLLAWRAEADGRPALARYLSAQDAGLGRAADAMARGIARLSGRLPRDLAALRQDAEAGDGFEACEAAAQFHELLDRGRGILARWNAVAAGSGPAAGDDIGAAMLAVAEFVSVGEQVSEQLFGRAASDLHLARGGLAPWQVRRCTDLLAADPARDFSLSALAAEVGLSPFHFARAFKQSLGMPPHAYLIHVRLATAKELLAATDLPITQIALEVGYESSQGLSRLFKRAVGVNPTAFRRSRGSGAPSHP